MQNKYVENTRTVLRSAIFGSSNHSIYSGKCIVPVPTVLPCCLSPSPRYYRGVCPHPRGITVNSVPITTDLLRFSRCPHPHAALYSSLSVSDWLTSSCTCHVFSVCWFWSYVTHSFFCPVSKLTRFTNLLHHGHSSFFRIASTASSPDCFFWTSLFSSFHYLPSVFGSMWQLRLASSQLLGTHKY